MAGFVALFQANSSPQDRETDFQNVLELTARFKDLKIPNEYAVGRDCTAAKLDAPSSLHCGIVHHEESGSWLLAAGSVVALEGNNESHALLKRLLVDYLENGPGALNRYDGHFALVIYNRRENCLSIVSDPMGLFAIYYARHGKQSIISTSALAIARQAGSQADALAVECFLRSGRPYGETTLWHGVKRVRPATLIKIMPDNFEELEYWRPKVDEYIGRLSTNEAVELANEKICHVFNSSLLGTGKVWADLTGGFDTRLTTLYLDKLGIPFVSYCVGPDGHPDVEVSRLVSKEMGWEYRQMSLPDGWVDEQAGWFDVALGKGDGLLNIFQLAEVLKSAHERSRSSFISVTGGCADEWRYHLFGARVLIPSAIFSINFDRIIDSRIFSDSIPLHAMKHDRTIESRIAIKEELCKITSGYAEAKKITQMDIAWLKFRHPIHSGAYLSALAGIIRSLTPFGFKELVNFGLSINHNWRIIHDFRFVRHLLEKENARLANIITEKDIPAIPIRLSNLHRFTPLAALLAGNVVGKVSTKLLGRRLYLRAPRHYLAYPLPEWKVAWLRWAAAENLLNPEQMHSGVLYNPATLGDLAAQSLSGAYPYSEFLDRVITVEMALRATGAEVE